MANTRVKSKLYVLVDGSGVILVSPGRDQGRVWARNYGYKLVELPLTKVQQNAIASAQGLR